MIKLSRPTCPSLEKLKTDYASPENKNALKESTNNKCMYCESKVSHADYGDVEHIRPKRKNPTLKFEWNNLGYSCTICNRDYKKECDDPLLINPYMDDPQDHLTSIGPLVVPKSSSQKGEFTYRVLGLNRLDLLTKRAKDVGELETLVWNIRNQTNSYLRAALIQEAVSACQTSEEYSMVKNNFVNELFQMYKIT